MVRLAIAIIGLLYTSLAIAAQPERFYIEVNPSSGTLDDIFVMSVNVEGIEEAAVPLLEGGDDFKLSLIGPRNEVRIVNGKVSSKVSYNYRLIPKHEGILETPAAEIEVGGEKRKAPALKVKVEKSSQSSAENEDIFVRQSIDKKKLFVGEQALNTLELFSSVRMIDPQISDMIYDDFWSKEIGEEQRSSRIMGGKQYAINRLSRAIFPQKSGELTIPSRTIRAKVLSSKSYNPFGGIDPFSDDFFGGLFSTRSYEEKSFRSNSLSVKVLELPAPIGQAAENLRRNDWGNVQVIVGRTELEAKLAEDDLKVGESRTLTIKIESKGNLSSLSKVPLDLGDRIRQYPDSPAVIYQEHGTALWSEKTFKLSLVPLGPGELKIPALKLVWFDPVSESYQIAETSDFKIQVTGQALSTQSSIPLAESTPTEQAAKPPPAETLKYEPETLLEKLSSQISTGLLAMLLVSLAFCLGIGWLLARWGRAKAAERSWRRKVETAPDIDTLYRHFYERLITRLGSQLSGGSESGAEALKVLVKARVPDPGRQYELLSLIDKFHQIRFGGEACDREGLNELKKLVTVTE
ncbi:MAG: hypothetical protein DCC75_01055 [Proteobacteria bacterium]|nr:MAG: hypothetical protein DCC75_01055 [Pseudomonadota bacterium]